ncbi:MAG TPA: glycosyltransferase [Pyrinomonadaceae bacterium]|nr:glycosyltransferase [Chloracidobacterium sp.]HRJ88621.1 glycosyltransferase [Pyrinomonadaceae bacterium]HRK48962.1 glycosyltransferase [Pyrinomonadaceae bacterium]
MTLNKLNKLIEVLRNYGFGRAARIFRTLHILRQRDVEYQRWIDSLVYADTGKLTPRLTRRPLISILMPVYNVDERWLRLAVRSVIEQTYDEWELCIADDASTASHIRPLLLEFAEADHRIKVVFRQTNGHISAATNSALEIAAGEFCVLMDNDDELSRDALFWVAYEIATHSDIAVVYSDEDLIDENGRRFNPRFKASWGRESIYAGNVATHLIGYRTELIREVGGFDSEFDGSQDHDLILRVTELVDERQIRHIPRILYHWRAIEGSVALDNEGKSYAIKNARRAISRHFERKGIDAVSEEGFPGHHRVRYRFSHQPKASIITRGDAEAIKSRTKYSNFEIVPSQEKASGEVFCFLNADTIPLNSDWLIEVIGIACQRQIGAVGGLAVLQNGAIANAGFVLGDGRVWPLFAGIDRSRLTSFQQLMMMRNVTAAGGGMIAISTNALNAVGGFDPYKPLGDIDLCLKLMDSGFRNVWTPFAEFEVSSPQSMNEIEAMSKLAECYPEWFASDPNYNPNLSFERAGYGLAFPPRNRVRP